MIKGGKILKAKPGSKESTSGGKTNADLLKYGRNMAKVVNQRRKG